MTGETGKVTLVFPARAEYLVLARLALTGLTRSIETNEEAVADVRLAVTEAASNVCRHAYAADGGVVRIVYTLDVAGRLEVVVEDEGRGIDVAGVRAWAPDGSTESGMGLSIIRAIADDLEIGPLDGGRGTRLCFTRALR